MSTPTAVIGDYTAAATIDGTTHYLLIQPGNAATAYKKISRSVYLGVTGQPADISSTQNLTNKTLDNTNTVTLKDTLFTLQDDGDTTKQAKFQLSGITTGTTRTYTLPNASSTLVDLASSQTLTNKTLTSPAISGGTIDNSTVTVDSVAGHTNSTSGTIYGITVTSGTIAAAGIASNAIITAKITDSAVTPAKLLTGTGSSWAWQSYTPTVANLTLGNGTLTASYIQIGNTVFGKISFTLGTTSAVGTTPTFSLPVTAKGYSTANWPIGQAYYVDTGVSSFLGTFSLLNSNTVGTPLAIGTASTYAGPVTLTTAIPLATNWGATDIMTFTFQYEAA